MDITTLSDTKLHWTDNIDGAEFLHEERAAKQLFKLRKLSVQKNETADIIVKDNYLYAVKSKPNDGYYFIIKLGELNV